MKTVTEHIRDSCFKKLKIVITRSNKTVEELIKSEWDKKFEELMRNRLVLGALRYGELHDPEKPTWNYLKAARNLINEYQDTGNDENLVDIANLCLLEFVNGNHPKKHFESTDKVNVEKK